MSGPAATGRPGPIDGGALLAQLAELGAVGADPKGGGRTRLALTAAEKEGRDLLVRFMREQGLEVRVDRVGNIFGTLAGLAGPGTAPLMVGSHIDTVRNAGALDGAYGVLAGLAVVRAFQAAHCTPPRPVTVAAFTNEEGVRYQPDMMGSLVHAGGLGLAEALNAVGTDGTRLGDELERIGYAGDLEPGSIVPREYLELHVEQGPILEAEKVQIGVVEALQGISWQKIAVEGVANHAGTTPNHLRHDAGYAAAAIVTFLREEVVGAARATTLATVGTLHLEPDVVNVIPGRATFTVDLRDPDGERLALAERRLSEFLPEIGRREGVKVTAERLVRCEPVLFDAGLAGEIEASARRLGFTHRRMTSGAGHDAQMMARIAPAAMIFVPSRGGVSHSPHEHTPDGELLAGAAVLLDVVARRLGAG
ncbi:MAG TPA: Zn-dependent hydrolase [Anaeromyxobacteraceae bacterium]|nr:Zn-dependent hydrolase [Anaeromyxobacteraceae bacterium]